MHDDLSKEEIQNMHMLLFSKLSTCRDFLVLSVRIQIFPVFGLHFNSHFKALISRIKRFILKLFFLFLLSI